MALLIQRAYARALQAVESRKRDPNDLAELAKATCVECS
jgi:hypothetical protein